MMTHIFWQFCAVLGFLSVLCVVAVLVVVFGGVALDYWRQYTAPWRARRTRAKQDRKAIEDLIREPPVPDLIRRRIAPKGAPKA